MSHFACGCLLAGLALTGACRPDSPAEIAHRPPPPAARQLRQLVGTWVAWPIRPGTSSLLVRIKPDSTGTFTMYGDRGRAFQRRYGGPRYYFAEGPVRASYRPHPPGSPRHLPNLEVKLDMRNAIFDYELRGDTLLEYDKMGLQGRLVRLHPTR